VPELPDLIYVRSRLETALLGRRVTSVRLRKPVVLRCLVPGGLELLVGQPLAAIDRRLHFLVFSFATHDLLVNPMLAGRFRLARLDARDEASLGFSLDFEATSLRYLDDKQMGKAYLAPSREGR
jgi:formamidopyrimidine-DNA glycosylase